MSGMSDASLAAHLADITGRLLLEVRNSGVSSRTRRSARRATRPPTSSSSTRSARRALTTGLLSEEMKCDGARLGMGRVWIVDPVDGTREYGERRADWAVHVGLAIDGVAQIGAVALPGLGLVLRSDETTPLPAPPERLRMVVSRTRPAKEAIAVAERMGAELVPMGSAGAKAMAVVLGQADIYLHTGGQYEWDSMAPVAVARAHGLHCSRIDGSPLVYNRENVYMPDLLIARPEHAAIVLEMLTEMVD